MDKITLNNLIAKAKKGDSSAIEKLYQESKDSIYFTCLKLVNNEQDALDLTQDTFITTFDKLDTLKDENTYFAWQKMIAINKCKNYLLKNKPVLFKSEEDEISTIDIKDTDEEFIPEAYIDNKAKRNIIINIIDNELSDAQRITITLFYYEEKKISEIATILNCSQGTVKSRMNSAKKLIKEAVLKEEKRGNKLYSVAPIPVLVLLLRESAKECSIPTGISNTILEGVKSHILQNKGGSIMAKVTSTLKGMTVTNLVITGVVGAMLIGGTGYVVVNSMNSDEKAVVTDGETYNYKKTLCGVEYTEIKKIENTLEVDNAKFSTDYNVDNVKYLEVKDGVLHTTIEMDIEDETIIYSTLRILKELLPTINKEKFENYKISGIEIIVKGKKNSWLMDIDDSLIQIEISN